MLHLMLIRNLSLLLKHFWLDAVSLLKLLIDFGLLLVNLCGWLVLILLVEVKLLLFNLWLLELVLALHLIEQLNFLLMLLQKLILNFVVLLLSHIEVLNWYFWLNKLRLQVDGFF